MKDVTDSTFEVDVLERSDTVPVVVDLWAPWCGPCRSLGPLIEEVIASTDGKVELTKVNVDENPRISATFQVQSIPAVYALKDRKIVDGFIGAVPKDKIQAFVSKLTESSSIDILIANGDEDSLIEALSIEPDNVHAIEKLAQMYVDNANYEGAISLIERVPLTPELENIIAKARLLQKGVSLDMSSVENSLNSLLGSVKNDETARQEFLDLLATIPSDDPLHAHYRKELSNRLF